MARVINVCMSQAISPESLRCLISVRCEYSQLRGSHILLLQLANCFKFRWSLSLTTTRQDGTSLVNQMSTRSAVRAPFMPAVSMAQFQFSLHSIFVVELFSISVHIVEHYYYSVHTCTWISCIISFMLGMTMFLHYLYFCQKRGR